MISYDIYESGREFVHYANTTKSNREIREELLHRYMQSHKNKEKYQEVLTKKKLLEISKQGLNIVLKCLRDACPKDTGYGRVAGIKYLDYRANKSAVASKVTFTIVIGSSRKVVKNHTIYSAPYIAYHNQINDWVWNALNKAKSVCKSNGIKLQTTYRNSNYNICSRYASKSGQGASGYKFTVSFR